VRRTPNAWLTPLPYMWKFGQRHVSGNAPNREFSSPSGWSVMTPNVPRLNLSRIAACKRSWLFHIYVRRYLDAASGIDQDANSTRKLGLTTQFDHTRG
jgi:hypothetical protein